MDEKISLKAVDRYSESFAQVIATEFFAGKNKITGPEILNLCEIRQVNLFAVRELMHAWNLESQKLQSPYFDYQAKPVVEALTNFQNTLSNHISIARNDFVPLLARAVSQTLFVILDPYDFYSDTLDRHGQGPIVVSELKNDIKYLKINRPPMERLIQKLEDKKLSSISGNEAFALLDSILEEVNFTPEDIEHYMPLFGKVVPLELEKLYEQTVRKAAPLATAKVERQVEAVDEKPVLNNFQKIATIKDNLTINQKFMFTKILFNGDFEIFSQAIDRLDSLDNLEQAMTYLESNFADWDKEGEEYLEFMEMLEKRFA